MPIIPIGSGKSEYRYGTNATMKSLLLPNVIVHPLPVQLIYCIFITLQTKGKTLGVTLKDHRAEINRRTKWRDRAHPPPKYLFKKNLLAFKINSKFAK